MEKRFEVKTTLSLQDNLALHKVHGKAQQTRFCLYSMLAAVAALYLWIRQDKYALLFTLLTVLLIACTLFYPIILGRLSYKKSRAEICENTYSFYDHKIGVRSAREDSLNDYDVFTQIQENSRYFFLYTKGTLVLVLPKRDFLLGNPEGFAAFMANKTGLTPRKLRA